MVLAGRSFGNDDGISYVDADNAGGAKMAVEYLLKSGREHGGHDRRAARHGPRGRPADRVPRRPWPRRGWAIPNLVMFGDFGRVSAEHALYRLLDRRPGIDAVFAASDLMAAGVLGALRRAGRRVPDDVAVIGFEDSPLAQHTDPKLTTVRQPVEAMGARMASRTARADRPGRPAARPRHPGHRTGHPRLGLTGVTAPIG